MDFTITKYEALLDTLIGGGYSFQTYAEYAQNPKPNSVILRHDVDLRPHNSLLFAQIQRQYGIKGTYYFRSVPQSWNTSVIEEIAALQHEIGYHYENLTVCHGDVNEAIIDFENNLEALRAISPVSTICMHGSPTSKYDSKDMWKEFNYKDYGIIGEPYFDLDFKEVFYLTDTGRCWDGWKSSIRDVVNEQEKWINAGLTFHTTDDIIASLVEGVFPTKAMFTFHPQRWQEKPIPWLRELLFQRAKNQVKRLLK